jgi:hypothetical protein
MHTEKLSPTNRKILWQRLLYRAFFIGILTVVLAPMCYMVNGTAKDFELLYEGFWCAVLLVCLLAFTMPCLDLLYSIKRIVSGETRLIEHHDSETGTSYTLEIYTAEGRIDMAIDGKLKYIVPQTVQTIHYARFSKIIFQIDAIEMVD